MNCELSNREPYFSSGTLNPEKQQEYPLEFINDHILEQALQVKRNLKDKRSSKAGSHRLKTPNSFQFDDNQSWGIEKEQRHHKTRQTYTPSKLSFQRKIRIKNCIRHKKSEETEIDFQEILSEQQRQLFDKISIHCLRARTEKLEQFSRSFQSEYTYAMHKLQKLRKAKEFSEKKQKKMEEIAEEKRRNTQEIQQSIRHNKQIARKRTLELKQHVLSQRAQKEQIIEQRMLEKKKTVNKLKENAFNLQHQRSQSLHHEAQEKQVNFMREKIEQIERKNFSSKMAERRKREAKIKFKNRWLSEFQNSQKAQNEMFRKQEQYSRKMVRIFQRMKSIQ